GRVIKVLEGHSGRIDSLAISPDGERIFSGGKDDNTVRAWDVASGEERATYRGHTERVHCLAISPDGRRLASGGEDRVIRVWDVTRSQENPTLPGSWISPDGKTIASLRWAPPRSASMRDAPAALRGLRDTINRIADMLTDF